MRAHAAMRWRDHGPKTGQAHKATIKESGRDVVVKVRNTTPPALNLLEGPHDGGAGHDPSRNGGRERGTNTNSVVPAESVASCKPPQLC